jgi:3-isopropylmalate/(R)-2-methylmalate dehydratase small subunit
MGQLLIHEHSFFNKDRIENLMMQSFQKISSNIIPIPFNNIDTDQIIPARYLKVTDKNGLAEGLFHSWRYDKFGIPQSTFPLNRPEYQEAVILAAGDNFGCGSSREHAPWALTSWGFRVIISSSFADIFRNNALKNGLLPVQVDPDTLNLIFEISINDPSARFSIDLSVQELIMPDGSNINFPIDNFNKICLLEGLDQLGYIRKFENEIYAYEQRRKSFETQ